MIKRLLPCALLVACASDGTDTGNPPVRGKGPTLDAFTTSECKTHGESSASVHALFRLRAALPANEELDGLACIRTTRTSATSLAVDYVNLTTSCGADGGFVPSVLTDTETTIALELRCEGPSAACGSCQYDLHYELQSNRLLELTEVTLQSDCFGVDLTQASALGAAASRLECRYTSVRSEGWAMVDAGTLRRQCRSLDVPGTTGLPACDGALVCTQVAERDSRCLAPCESDDDCALPGLERCESGLCRLPGGVGALSEGGE